MKHTRCSDKAISINTVKSLISNDLHSKLVPGDILLTQTHGFLYSLWRRLSCTIYDHTAVVLKNDETLNVVYPVAIRLPVSHFSGSGKSPVALRPVWRNENQLQGFLHFIEQLEGTHYNSFRGLFNITNMMTYYRLGLKIPLKVPELTSKRWVCTDAILIYLYKTIPEFSKIEALDLDLFRFGFTSPNDFLRIAYYMPDLLKSVC
ncbi:MAG: hypothetical protein ACP5JP_07815 [bacterium]